MFWPKQQLFIYQKITNLLTEFFCEKKFINKQQLVVWCWVCQQIFSKLVYNFGQTDDCLVGKKSA